FGWPVQYSYVRTTPHLSHISEQFRRNCFSTDEQLSQLTRRFGGQLSCDTQEAAHQSRYGMQYGGFLQRSCDDGCLQCSVCRDEQTAASCQWHTEQFQQ